MADDRLSADEQLEIVCLILDGEQEGILRLLRTYAPRVEWLLMARFDGLLSREDTEEIIQTAALKIWKNARQFDDSRGTLGGWFYRIAYRAALDVLRGGPDGDERPVELTIEPGVSGRTPDCLDNSPDQASEIDHALLEEIETLGKKQKAVILADMAAGGEADASFLAEQLGIPKQHIYSYRNKAHAALKKRLERRGHTAETLGIET